MSKTCTKGRDQIKPRVRDVQMPPVSSATVLVSLWGVRGFSRSLVLQLLLPYSLINPSSVELNLHREPPLMLMLCWGVPLFLLPLWFSLIEVSDGEGFIDRKWSDCQGGKTARALWLIANKLPPSSSALKCWFWAQPKPVRGSLGKAIMRNHFPTPLFPALEQGRVPAMCYSHVPGHQIWRQFLQECNPQQSLEKATSDKLFSKIMQHFL